MERTVLGEEAFHGRAARASVEPENNWISCRVALRLNEPVVQFFRVGDGQVTGIHVEVWEAIEAGEGGDLVGVGGRGEFFRVLVLHLHDIVGDEGRRGSG